MQQEMIENIKEHAAESQRTSADAKRAVARRERAEADNIDADSMQKMIISDGASMEDTQDAVSEGKSFEYHVRRRLEEEVGWEGQRMDGVVPLSQCLLVHATLATSLCGLSFGLLAHAAVVERLFSSHSPPPSQNHIFHYQATMS